MTLANALASIPLLRENGPGGTGPLTLIIHSSQFPQIAAFPGHGRISHILLVDVPAGTPFTVSAPASLKHANIAAGLSLLPELAHTETVFFTPPWITTSILQAVQPLAKRKTWLYGDAAVPNRQPLPDYLQQNEKELERAFALMANKADKHAFASRVKALQTGQAGYLPIAPHAEYEHPLIRPMPGDTMLDGGLSDMVGAQKYFCETIGPGGCIHGFEPIKWMAAKAAEQLEAYPQYHVHAAGLADKNGEAEFASLRDSSHLAAGKGEDTETCQLVTMDSFTQGEGVNHVDCIKLDIEGAELAALHGARKVITRDKPKLIICMYHKPQDLREIPLYIHDLAPDYTMHLAHSSCTFTDTILYAVAK